MYLLMNIFVFFSVTENHPAVQEILLKTMNEAGKSVVHPIDLYAEVLEKHIKKVLKLYKAKKYRFVNIR